MNEETTLIDINYCSKNYLIELGFDKKAVKKVFGKPDLVIKNLIGESKKNKYYEVEKVKSILCSNSCDEYIEDREEILLELLGDNSCLDSRDELTEFLIDLVEIDEEISEFNFRELVGGIIEYHLPASLIIEMEESLVNYLFITLDALAREYRYNKANNIEVSKSIFQKLVFTYLILMYTNIDNILGEVVNSRDYLWENMVLQNIFFHFKAENKYLNRFFQGLDVNPITKAIYFLD